MLVSGSPQEVGFAALASDPLQYDKGAVQWSLEGSTQSPRRQLMLGALAPYLERMAGQDVVDIGAGQGWLCAAIARAGGTPVGVEPSKQNIAAASEQHPGITFVQASLDTFDPGDQCFDWATVIMASEHFVDFPAALSKLRQLLRSSETLLILAGDHDLFTRQRFDFTVETEETGIPGETAVRTDYGEQGGVICDIVRTPERVITSAGAAGFMLAAHHELTPTPELIASQPKYKELADQPLFHLYAFDSQGPQN